MKMIILLGSPRKGANSETLARKVAEGFGGDVDYVRLNNLTIRPCRGCGGCDKTGGCIIDDDMSILYTSVDNADRVVLVSPVYFYGLSAQCKTFGDRFQARWARKYLLKKRFREGEGRKGYLLSTAATRGSKIFACSVLTTKYIFDAMDIDYGGEMLVKGVDHRKALLDYPERLAEAVKFGRDIDAGII